MTSPYPHLTSSFDLGPVTLRSRVVMGSMHTGMEDRAKDARELAAFYAERARGGVGLIVTGGYSPTLRGALYPLASTMRRRSQLPHHRLVTDAVHAEGGAIVLQLLHAGRYAYHPLSQSASAKKSPITPFTPRAMSGSTVERTVRAFGRAAALAREAGYDGVEIMGSEGYLLNQFLATRVNDRTDAWGGSPQARRRLPVEVVRAVREAAGPDFVIGYRLSVLDLVEGGQTWEETVALAREVEHAGATLINTGIGWHEARVPTIVTSVPRAAFVEATSELAAQVGIPVVASNRINDPEVAEEILAAGQADLVSMARPLLADPAFVTKARAGRADEINTCIACNQACLDHTFTKRRASCLVNPRAGHETTLVLGATRTRKRVAVVGAGPAGLAAATSLAERGHDVDLYEAGSDIGGQFALARQIPGKEEFAETLRYFRRRIEVTGVRLHLGQAADVDTLAEADEVVLATGVRPRIPDVAGIDHPSVVSYADLLAGRAGAGERVAVMGAGGIGVDVCEWLTHDDSPTLDLKAWQAEWGVGSPKESPGGLVEPTPSSSPREVWLLQRKTSRIGAGLGKTTGWVHRASLAHKGVHLVTGVTYDRVDDQGLHITRLVDGEAHSEVLDVDTVVVCAGQESRRELADELTERGVTLHVIGGADVAAELDAKRAIDQATRLAAAI